MTVWYNSHVQMWELDHREGWVLKSWCFWTVVLRRLGSPLGCKEIQPVHPKGDQSWVFIGRTDAEAETPVLWPPDGKRQLTRKGPDAGKDWGREKRVTEDEMVGWDPQLNGHGFMQSPGDSEGQGSPTAVLAARSRTCLNDWTTTRIQEVHSVVCIQRNQKYYV